MVLVGFVGTRGRPREGNTYAIEYGMTPGQRPELDVAKVDRLEW